MSITFSKSSRFLRGAIDYFRQTGNLTLPDLFVIHRGGLGDAVLLSVLLRELHLRKKKFAVVCPHQEIFRELPYGGAYFQKEFPAEGVGRFLGIPIYTQKYVKPLPPAGRSEQAPKQHILAEMCAQAGLTGEVVLKPEFALSNEELAAAAGYRGVVVVQSTCMTAKFRMWTKDWGIEKMQQVVVRLKKTHRIVQIGSKEDSLLKGVEDRRGMPIRHAAALLAVAGVFIGLVGFLMHLARAVNTRSVIIYGGREKPWQSGYIAFTNLDTNVVCSPCWRYDDCPGNKQCMEMVAPQMVVDAALTILEGQKSAEMPTERIILQPKSF